MQTAIVNWWWFHTWLHAVSELPLLTFFMGVHLYPANDFTQIWPGPRLLRPFDLISSPSPDHGHAELNHAPCGIVALYPKPCPRMTFLDHELYRSKNFAILPYAQMNSIDSAPSSRQPITLPRERFCGRCLLMTIPTPIMTKMVAYTVALGGKRIVETPTGHWLTYSPLEASISYPATRLKRIGSTSCTLCF